MTEFMAASPHHVTKNRAVGPLIDEMDLIFQAQKEAFHKAPMPDAQERITHLNRLKIAMIRYQDRIVRAIDEDFVGRARDETLIGEFFPSVEGIRYAVKRIRRWMKPQRRRMALMFQPGRARIIYQPLGVVGIVAPWNYPLYLTVSPLTAALAAGNRVMIKMSEYTPKTAEIVRQMLADTFKQDHVAVVTGGAGLAAAFSAKPWNHLLFTGSTDVGRHVMRTAAENLTPVTLELGGKSPAIIGPDTPVAEAAERIAFGKAFNAGQTCVAPDYVFCPRPHVNRFVASFQRCAANMYPTMETNADYTSIINSRRHERLQQLIADAKAKGARVDVINPAGEAFADTRKMPIYVLRDVTEDMSVMQEEIFGPILPVMPYDALADAVAYVNAHPRPLALYYFGYTRQHRDYILDQTHSGGVLFNDTLIHAAQDDLPFGGVGASGMGRYHGREGFITFSNPRGVVFKLRFNSSKMIYPPYNRPIHRLIYKLFLR